jgi:hypothetical protein
VMVGGVEYDTCIISPVATKGSVKHSCVNPSESP